MPLYEYKCSGCGETFEVIQKFSDAPLKTHDKCGGPVERLISPSALQFKGTGWYVTDYAGGNGKKTRGKDAKESKKESASTDSASKTAPAASDKAPASDKKV